MGKYDDTMMTGEAIKSRRMEKKLMQEIKRNRHESMTNLNNHLSTLLPIQEAYEPDNEYPVMNLK